MRHVELRIAGEHIKSSAGFGPVLQRAGRWLTAGAGHGAAAGAAIGAAHGLATRRPDESALHAGITGGLRGGVVGAAVGHTGRAYRDIRLDPTHAGISHLGTAGELVRGAGRAVKQFGQRQLHGFTGKYTDRPGSIGLRGSETAEKTVQKLDRRFADRKSYELGPKSVEEHASAIKDIREQGRHGDAALHAGITSIPGIAKNMVRHPIGTAKALGREFVSGGRAGVALGIGAPIAMAAPGLARGDESATGGMTRVEKLKRLGTSVGAGALTMGLPVIPQMAASTGVEYGLNRIARRKPPAVKPPAVVYGTEQ